MAGLRLNTVNVIARDFLKALNLWGTRYVPPYSVLGAADVGLSATVPRACEGLTVMNGRVIVHLDEHGSEQLVHRRGGHEVSHIAQSWRCIALPHHEPTADRLALALRFPEPAIDDALSYGPANLVHRFPQSYASDIYTRVGMRWAGHVFIGGIKKLGTERANDNAEIPLEVEIRAHGLHKSAVNTWGMVVSSDGSFATPYVDNSHHRGIIVVVRG
jgi:hypothetical protein